MNLELQAVQKFLQKPESSPAACCCMGPRDNDPGCPCEMRWMVVVNDQYFRISKNPTATGYDYVAERVGNVNDDYRGAREIKAIENLERRSIARADSNFAQFVKNTAHLKVEEEQIGSMSAR